MNVIKNAAGKWLVETDEKGLRFLLWALASVDDLECLEGCPYAPDAECMEEMVCGIWRGKIDEALNG